MNKVSENNKVTISGEIASDFIFNHELFGEKFYLVYINVPHKSGYMDRLPVIVSERLMDIKQNLMGLNIIVRGQYRSYNRHDADKNRLILSVFAMEVEILDESLESYENNFIYIEGFVVKEPIYRVTPLGREIADLLIAVNRPYGKSDYIPCICWGRNAKFASNFEIGTKCIIQGRIQSRFYNKILNDGSIEERTAYEVSVNRLKKETVNEIRL